MLTKFQTLANRILGESQSGKFETTEDLVDAVTDVKYGLSLENLQKDENLMKMLKNTDIEILDEASKEIYVKMESKEDDQNFKNFLESIFNFLKEIKNFNEKAV